MQKNGMLQLHSNITELILIFQTDNISGSTVFNLIAEKRFKQWDNESSQYKLIHNR